MSEFMDEILFDNNGMHNMEFMEIALLDSSNNDG